MAAFFRCRIESRLVELLGPAALTWHCRTGCSEHLRRDHLQLAAWDKITRRIVVRCLVARVLDSCTGRVRVMDKTHLDLWGIRRRNPKEHPLLHLQRFDIIH